EKVRSGGPLPALILLDLHMPRMDGWALMTELKKDARLASIPVLLVSGYAKLGAEAETMGARGYLRKPVRAEQLLQAVGRWQQRGAWRRSAGDRRGAHRIAGLRNRRSALDQGARRARRRPGSRRCRDAGDAPERDRACDRGPRRSAAGHGAPDRAPRARASRSSAFADPQGAAGDRGRGARRGFRDRLPA